MRKFHIYHTELTILRELTIRSEPLVFKAKQATTPLQKLNSQGADRFTGSFHENEGEFMSNCDPVLPRTEILILVPLSRHFPDNKFQFCFHFTKLRANP